MPSPREEIKALLINALHADRAAEYRKRLQEKNGRPPTPEEENSFLAVVIASGNIPEEAEDLIKTLLKKPTKHILLNTGYSVAALSIFGIAFVIFLEGKIPDFLVAYRTTGLISAGVLFVITALFSVLFFFRDNK